MLHLEQNIQKRNEMKIMKLYRVLPIVGIFLVLAQNLGFAVEITHGLSYTYLLSPSIETNKFGGDNYYLIKKEKFIEPYLRLLQSFQNKQKPSPFYKLRKNEISCISSYVCKSKKVIQITFANVLPDSLKEIKPFHFQKTHITQWQYIMIMADEIDENPSHFKNDDETIQVKIGEKIFTMQPNHPIEQISWYDAQRFIRKLNELGSVNDSLIYQLIPDHQIGDIYRLPIESEWLFIADATEVTKYQTKAWHNENTQKTQKVATLEPSIIKRNVHDLPINDAMIYDMLGNVRIWLADKRIDSGNDDDPRICRGSSWNDSWLIMKRLVRISSNPNLRSPNIGMRLVRQRNK